MRVDQLSDRPVPVSEGPLKLHRFSQPSHILCSLFLAIFLVRLFDFWLAVVFTV
jgi:hypothetical protein